LRGGICIYWLFDLLEAPIAGRHFRASAAERPARTLPLYSAGRDACPKHIPSRGLFRLRAHF
jgi:hypothetical protein